MPPNTPAAVEDTPEIEEAQVVDTPEIAGAIVDAPTIQDAEELE